MKLGNKPSGDSELFLFFFLFHVLALITVRIAIGGSIRLNTGLISPILT